MSRKWIIFKTLFLQKKGNRRTLPGYRKGMKLPLLLLCVAAALALLRLKTDTPDTISTLKSASCLTLSITGEVESIRKYRGKQRIIINSREAQIIRLGRKKIRGKLLVYSRAPIRLQRGTMARVYGESVPLKNGGNPDLPEAAVFRPKKISGFPPRSLLKKLLNRIRNGTASLLNGAGKELAPFLRAFFLGDRSGLPEKQMTVFRNTGLAHCLSVSGFHVGLLALLLERLLRFLHNRLRLSVILLALLLFTLLTGARPSTIRAALIFSAAAVFRGTHPGGLLCLCAAGMLLFSPGLLLSFSAALSFTACAGIILLTPGILRLFTRITLPEWIALPLAVSIAAQTALLPLLAAAFKQVSLIAPLSNTLLLPFFLICCLASPPLLLLSAATGWDAPMAAVNTLFRLFEKTAAAAAKLPCAILKTESWDFTRTVLWYASISFLCIIFIQLNRIRMNSLARQLRESMGEKSGYSGTPIVSLPDSRDGGNVERDPGSN